MGVDLVAGWLFVVVFWRVAPWCFVISFSGTTGTGHLINNIYIFSLPKKKSKPIQIHRRDEWVWTADPSGQYTAQSAYNMLRGEAIVGIQDRAFEELWKLKVPIKFAVFAWRLLRDRLSTKINLHRRQVEVIDRSCPFCRSSKKEAGHLFFHCSRIIPIWWESLSWVNNSGVFSQDPRQHFLQHGSIIWDKG